MRESHMTEQADIAASWDDDVRVRFVELATRSDRAYLSLADLLSAVVAAASPDRNWTVLDVGCGLGFLTAQLSSIGFDVTGLDLSPLSIAKAEQAFGESATFVVGDIASPAAGCDRDYGVVLANMVMHNYPYLDEFLSGCRSVLLNDGIFIGTIADPASYLAKQHLTDIPDKTRLRVPLRHRECKGNHTPVPYFHRVIDSYMEALREAGFDRVEVTARPKRLNGTSRHDVVLFVAAAGHRAARRVQQVSAQI